jgi:hypothetical protein
MKGELGRWTTRQRTNLALLRAHRGKIPCGIGANGTPTSLFILGPGRSGKSTMEKLVGTLDGIKQGYENPVVENALERTLRTGSFIDRLPARLHSIFRDNYREELAQRTGSAKVFINTNSGLVHRALLMAMVCPNVRFLCMKRDLEDNLLRIYMKDWRINPQTYDLRATRDFITWYHQMMDLLFPQIVCVVHYENMVTDPAGTLQTLADWLELPMPAGSLPVLGDDRGCARPYHAFMAARLEDATYPRSGASIGVTIDPNVRLWH